MAKAKGQAVQIWHYFLKGGLATLNSELHNSCIYQQPILVTQVILQPNYAIASFPPNNVKFRTLGHLIFNKSDMRWILRCYVWWFDDSNWGSHMFSRPEGWESLDFTNSGRNTHTHTYTHARPACIVWVFYQLSWAKNPPLWNGCIIAESPTSRSQHWIHAYSKSLVTASRAGNQVDWGLGIDVVMSRYCIVVDWPEALIWVLMRFNDQIHTILKKQRFEAGEDKNRKASHNYQWTGQMS